MRMAKERRARRSFMATGHRLGSALATLFVTENTVKNKFDISAVCALASPRVGNAASLKRFNQLPLTSWRIVNTQDIVPEVALHLPFYDYRHVATRSSPVGEGKRNACCWGHLPALARFQD
jgi:predicted lipase